MTDETNLETIIVALLKTSSAITLMPYRASEDTLPEQDYIAVIVDNKQPAMVAHTEDAKPIMWGAKVTIAVDVATRTASKLEGIMTAIDSLMEAATPPAAILALAAAAFPNGNVRLQQTTGGEEEMDDTELRKTTRFYNAWWAAN